MLSIHDIFIHTHTHTLERPSNEGSPLYHHTWGYKMSEDVARGASEETRGRASWCCLHFVGIRKGEFCVDGHSSGRETHFDRSHVQHTSDLKTH